MPALQSGAERGSGWGLFWPWRLPKGVLEEVVFLKGPENPQNSERGARKDTQKDGKNMFDASSGFMCLLWPLFWSSEFLAFSEDPFL